MTTQPDPYVAPTTDPVVEKPKKRKRVFMWFFLAVQAIFIIWIIAGANSASSSGNCNGLDKASCDAATAVGTGIGVALVIGLWVAVDIILGIIYLVVRASRR